MGKNWPKKRKWASAWHGEKMAQKWRKNDPKSHFFAIFGPFFPHFWPRAGPLSSLYQAAWLATFETETKRPWYNTFCMGWGGGPHAVVRVDSLVSATRTSIVKVHAVVSLSRKLDAHFSDPLIRRHHENDSLRLRLKWPFTEWETGPEQKSRKNWKENGKLAPRPKWPKMANRNGKMDPKMGFWPDSMSAAIFRPFQAWGHFPFSFPFFRNFCSRPVSHSVNGHFNRNPENYFFRNFEGFFALRISGKRQTFSRNFQWNVCQNELFENHLRT